MSYKQLSIEEREIIQTMWWERKSIREIAKNLSRSPSSISRELIRNFPKEHRVYTPRLANERALTKRKSRGRKDRLKNEKIRTYVIDHLKQRWSPEQIAGRMRIDIHQSISHEAIYQYIYNQINRDGYGLLKIGKEDLRIYLRRKRKRRFVHGGRRSQRIFKPEGISIDERPTIVNERRRVGDWEGDSVESVNHKPGINTLVERKTGYLLMTKLKDRKSNTTVRVVTDRFFSLPTKIKKTLTLDNGPENRDWQLLESNTNLSVFFAHPYCSGERGTNENTNGLIRDYFPKKTDFDNISDEEISLVEEYINNRPRKRHNWRTPLEEMSVALRG